MIFNRCIVLSLLKELVELVIVFTNVPLTLKPYDTANVLPISQASEARVPEVPV